ncbi:TPA: Rep family protein [Streptococcus suis]
MAKKSKGSGNKNDKMSAFAVTQALYKQHWDGDKWDLDKIEAKDIKYIAMNMVKLLSDVSDVKLKAFYAIVHDNDVQTDVWDETTKKYVVVPKHIHMHGVGVFESKEGGLSIDKIAEAIGLKSQYIEKPSRGRYAVDNMLAYLIHAKDEEKYQYLPTDVISVVKDDDLSYKNIYAERKLAWEKGRAHKSTRKATSTEDVDSLYLKVVTGEITYQQIQLSDDLFRIYALNMLKFDKGFEAYRNRRMAIASERMRRGELRTKVLYIQGRSRSGKSKFTKQLAEAFVKNAETKGLRWEWGSGGATNPTEQYTGQEVFVLNDMREESMRPEDWLRLLDPENDEAIYGRYKSKVVCPEWIIISCHLDVYDFFNAIRQRSRHFEPMDQFIGRLMAMVTVVSRNDVRLYPQIEYDDEKYMSRDNRPVDYDDGYGAEPLRFGFTDSYLPLPSAMDEEKMLKLADYLMTDGDIVGLVQKVGVKPAADDISDDVSDDVIDVEIEDADDGSDDVTDAVFAEFRKDVTEQEEC